MPIQYLPSTRSFFLSAAGMTYALKVLDFGCMSHLHWGPELAAQDLDFLLPVRGRAFSPNPAGAPTDFSLNDLPLEYPAHGNSDLRAPAFEVTNPRTGSAIVDLRYVAHSIQRGKPPLAGLPATWVENEDDAETLTIELRDPRLGLQVDLLYSVFAKHPVLTRSARFVNRGTADLRLLRALSASVDFADGFADYHFLQLSGNWARERNVVATPLRPGLQAVESRRGTSSHQHNPFFVLAENGTSEETGSVYGFNLVYSGNFLASVEVDEDHRPRAQIGLNPAGFAWKLEPGEAFQTPETVLVYSPAGLGGMSRALHRFYRQHLCRSVFQHRARPVVINNWEATYFDFDTDKLERLAQDAAGAGIELFVLDDGWFGRRDDDKSSLGDWVADRRKLPGGLEDLAERISRAGLKFGLWLEPEMVSPDSDLHRAHPDWCLHVPGLPRTLGRNQLVLDLSRTEVREEVYRSVARLLGSVPIAYVKWDMNRHLTEVFSPAWPADRQPEIAHRYVLGLYALLERLTKEFPEVLFEGCSGGGGRFDPGILHYMPQIWTSDNSDAISRLKIQYGTSLAYPLGAMAAHVSVVPNHQVGRTTPFVTRGHVAFTGAFGYELDLAKLDSDERAEVRRQTGFYRKVETLLREGDLYRLRSPFTTNEAAWMVVAADCSEALVTWVNILAEPNPPTRFLRLRGLDPDREYLVDGQTVRRGDGLMHAGLPTPHAPHDFTSVQWHLVGQ